MALSSFGRVGLGFHSSTVRSRRKKRLARTLIEEVVLDVDSPAGWIEAVIHGKAVALSLPEVYTPSQLSASSAVLDSRADSSNVY